VSLVAVVFVIAGIITALFVMKRRFSILRINGSKCAGDDGHNNDGAANGMLTSNSGSDSSQHSETVSTSDAKCIEINEKDTVDAVTSALKEAANDQQLDLVCVENKQAVLLPASGGGDNENVVIESAMPVTVVNEAGSSEELLPKEVDEVVVPEGELVNTEVVAVETVTTNDVNNEVVTTLQVEATTTTTTLTTNTTTSSSSLIANVLNELSESVVLKLQSSDPEKQPLNLE
jgi:hypothetical protein